MSYKTVGSYKSLQRIHLASCFGFVSRNSVFVIEVGLPGRFGTVCRPYVPILSPTLGNLCYIWILRSRYFEPVKSEMCVQPSKLRGSSGALAQPFLLWSCLVARVPLKRAFALYYRHGSRHSLEQRS